MKRVAHASKPPVVVPVVVVAVDVHLALVVPTVERGEIVRDTIYATTPRILLELYFIWDLKSANASHQVSSFFVKCLHTPLYPKP